MTLDTTNMCSQLQKKLFDEDGRLWVISDSYLTSFDLSIMFDLFLQKYTKFRGKMYNYRDIL